MKYEIKRSRRKTIGLQITDNGLLVRAPLRASKSEIERVVADHRDWIEKKTARYEDVKRSAHEKGLLSEDDIARLIDEAREYIPGRVEYYAEKLGAHPGRITIRKQRSRWGSCSAKGNLNFNCLLMLTPPEVIDSIVAHELCHLFEMNHSSRFYDKLLDIFPDYHRHHDWLKKNGPEIMARAVICLQEDQSPQR